MMMMAFLGRKPIIMEFGILLFVLVQLTTTIESGVAISNSTLSTPATSTEKSNATITQQEVGHESKTADSPGFIKKMTTQIQSLTCKVGLFCENKGTEGDETNKEKSEEKPKVGREESSKNSSIMEELNSSSNSSHHDPGAEKKSEMRKPESEASTSA